MSPKKSSEPELETVDFDNTVLNQYTPDVAIAARRIAQLQVALRRAHADFKTMEERTRKDRDALKHLVRQRDEQQLLAHGLARANAESAELMVELEMKNRELQETNVEIARANAHASELMVTLEIKDDSISKLNKSLSSANVRAAQLLAEREMRLEELDKVNKRLKSEVIERKKAQKELAHLAEELKAANANLDRLATVDTLTDLLNRRGLQRSLDMELSRVQRLGTTIGVIFVDIDDFKTFNDAWGHAVGDQVLVEITNRFKQCLRASDFLGRIGGDEFMAILPVITEEVLLAVAERIRSEVASSPLVVVPEEINGTISLGVAVLPPAVSNITDILRLTRAALKSSKSAGKNKVTVIDSAEAKAAIAAAAAAVPASSSASRK